MLSDAACWPTWQAPWLQFLLPICSLDNLLIICAGGILRITMKADCKVNLHVYEKIFMLLLVPVFVVTCKQQTHIVSGPGNDLITER
jgi:hypothetical protein